MTAPGLRHRAPNQSIKFYFRHKAHSTYKTSCARGAYLFARCHLFRHVGYLRHQQVDLWPFDLETGVRVTRDVGYLCANFSLPKPLCSRVTPDVRDRQTDVTRQTDVRQKHCNKTMRRNRQRIHIDTIHRERIHNTVLNNITKSLGRNVNLLLNIKIRLHSTVLKLGRSNCNSIVVTLLYLINDLNDLW